MLWLWKKRSVCKLCEVPTASFLVPSPEVLDCSAVTVFTNLASKSTENQRISKVAYLHSRRELTSKFAVHHCPYFPQNLKLLESWLRTSLHLKHVLVLTFI